MMFALADIGATNARFAMFQNGSVSNELDLRCDDYPTLDDGFADYLDKVNISGQTIPEFRLSVAGPVVDEMRVPMTNHAWVADVAILKKRFGFGRVRIVNDFYAIAAGIPFLPSETLVQIGAGNPVAGKAIGVIGPGTGLGVASLFWDGSKYIPNAGEGSHVTAAGTNTDEEKIIARIREKYGHASIERLCSGMGIENIYGALCAMHGAPEPLINAAAISDRAIAGNDDLAKQTLDLFCGFLGGAAGNLALTLGAHGGVYIGGGIVPKILEFFKTSPFRDRFTDKGRYHDYLSAIPTYVITHPYPAYIGLIRAF